MGMEWSGLQFQRSASQFKKFMLPAVAVLGRCERQKSAAAYVQGLLMPGHRKSIEPMAQRLGVDTQGLQHFMSSSPWCEKTVWSVIRGQIIPHFEPIQAWVVDETGWIKQGKHSVGVAPQYCGSVGKKANCQVSVEVVVTDGWIAAPIGGRLYLPEQWIEDRARCERAGIPEGVEFATKPMIALEIIQEALSEGVAPAPVLADAVYGDNADFRAGLKGLGLEFFLQVDAGKHKGWSFEVPTEVKWVRRHPKPETPPSRTLREMAAEIPELQWESVHWKTTGGKEGSTRLAWCEVWLQHGLRKAGGDLEKLWLVVDWPAGAAEPYHYYLAHLHRAPSKARCLTLSRSRWHIEQYFQRAKDDLGLDHYEGRSWRGFHHHLVLSVLAYLFILTVHADAKKNFWCDVGGDPASDPSMAGEIDRLLLLLQHEFYGR